MLKILHSLNDSDLSIRLMISSQDAHYICSDSLFAKYVYMYMYMYM